MDKEKEKRIKIKVNGPKSIKGGASQKFIFSFREQFSQLHVIYSIVGNNRCLEERVYSRK